MFKFKKLGLVFKPSPVIPWMKSHAQVPTVLELEDCYRIYFSTRPQSNLSLMGYVDLCKNDPFNIIRVSEKPVLETGEAGTFDEFGVMPSSVIKKNNSIYLYYTGWSRGTTVPYLNAIGLAISNDEGKTFVRHSLGPILGISKNDPFSVMSPYVLADSGQWYMWYSSGTKWHYINGKYEPIYNIKYALSNNAIDWETNNEKLFIGKLPLEANTRPSVVKVNNIYHMWFCYRGGEDFRGGKQSYRIGYASSIDLKNWQRNDEITGISPSDKDFDSEMIEYPQVTEFNNRLLMFYNGNEFGKDGFAIAEAYIN